MLRRGEFAGLPLEGIPLGTVFFSHRQDIRIIFSFRWCFLATSGISMGDSARPLEAKFSFFVPEWSSRTGPPSLRAGPSRSISSLVEGFVAFIYIWQGGNLTPHEHLNTSASS